MTDEVRYTAQDVEMARVQMTLVGLTGGLADMKKLLGETFERLSKIEKALERLEAYHERSQPEVAELKGAQGRDRELIDALKANQQRILTAMRIVFGILGAVGAAITGRLIINWMG